MITNRHLACLVLLAGASVYADEAPAKAAELKQLEALVGSWETQATFKVAEWNPKEIKATGTCVCEWVLDGRVIQGKGTDTTKADHIMQWTYDMNMKQYRGFFFDSKGTVVEWRGTWNAETKSFNMKHDHPMPDLEDSFTMRVVDEDTIEWKSEVKGKDGKLYFGFEAKWTRKK